MRSFSANSGLFFQIHREEIYRALPCVGRVSGAVAVFVIWIFKAVTTIVIDLDVDLLPLLFHGCFEFMYVVRRDALILAAEQSEHGSVDFLESFGIGGELAVVNDVSGERGLLKCDIERVAAAHAPSNRSDAVLLHVRLRLKKFERGMQIALGAVFRDTAQEFMRHLGRSRHFAAI